MSVQLVKFMEFNKRAAAHYKEVLERCVKAINAHIDGAKETPIYIPRGAFSDLGCVRTELVRMLEDVGWVVALVPHPDGAGEVVKLTGRKEV